MNVEDKDIKSVFFCHILMMFKISDLVISFILSVFINIGISFTDKKTMFVPFDIALCVRFIVAWNI